MIMDNEYSHIVIAGKLVSESSSAFPAIIMAYTHYGPCTGKAVAA